MLAPAQGGYHVNGRETHGDSMIVDPWGVVLDRLPRGSGVVVAGVNLQYLRGLRQSLPALTHRTLRPVLVSSLKFRAENPTIDAISHSYSPDLDLDQRYDRRTQTSNFKL